MAQTSRYSGISVEENQEVEAFYQRGSNQTMETPDNFSTPSSEISAPPHRISVTFPMFSAALLLGAVFVFYLSDWENCSEPLATWDMVFIGRHLLKSLLHDIRTRYWPAGSAVPPRLLLAFAITEFSGPAIWSLGGYFIANTATCSQGIYIFSWILWVGQTLGMLLPCCFLSTIIFCVPFLVRIAPYLIRPNPNTVAAGREVISKLNRTKYSEAAEFSSASPESCSICLGEYAGDDVIVKLPCGHIFHSGCIENWLNLSQLCPVDRSNVVDRLESQQRGDEIV